jgi:hypothetical protein
MIDFKKLKKHQVIPVIYRIDVLLGNVYAETFKNCEVICCNSTKDLSDFEIKEKHTNKLVYHEFGTPSHWGSRIDSLFTDYDKALKYYNSMLHKELNKITENGQKILNKLSKGF